MRRWAAAVIVLVPMTSRAAADDARPAGRDPAAEVRDVFAARCAGCHGPNLPKPQGRFGYVLDLRRVAGNPEMVIPARPDESELWALVRRDEMPPPDSPQGALTMREKVVIHDWIATGAPAAPADPVEPPAVPPVQRTARWLGRFHLLLLHFPIALVLAAGIGEFRSPPAARFCLLLAAAAVVPTVALGWLHAIDNGVGSPALLAAHRWLGTAAGAWVVGTALVAHRGAGRGWVRAFLAVGILLVVATAHVGGLIAHGRDFLDW